MNVLLWILQALLALHTAVGAMWKLTNPENSMPSLRAIPHGMWLAMSGVEMLAAIALIVPATARRPAIVTPIAAAFVAVEMLFLSGVHIASGATSIGPVIYWLAVAAVAAFIVYGRLLRKRIRRPEFA